MLFKNKNTNEVVSYKTVKAFAEYIEASPRSVATLFSRTGKYKDWVLVEDVTSSRSGEVISSDLKKIEYDNGAVVYKKYEPVIKAPQETPVMIKAEF